MGAIWRLEMLGTFQVRRAESTVTRFRTRRVAVLLAYLGLFPNRHHFRDEIGEMLWPDSELSVSRRNLRQALLSLRHALEPPPMPSGSVVQVMQSHLQLHPQSVVTDVAEFERLLGRAKAEIEPRDRVALYQQAVSLYKGELLPGFDEVWVLNERLRMEDLYLYALGQLIKESEALGLVEESIPYLRLAIAKEPLNEVWHTSLMWQYLKLGRAQNALTQYEELSRLLQIELNCEPDEDARKLAAKARREAGGGSAKVTANVSDSVLEEVPVEPKPERIRLPVQLTRLFGRQAEIQELKHRLEDTQTRLATILGPAGTGKTRLAVEVGRSLADQGWSVWFVPLADMDDGSLLPDRILEVLKPRSQGRSDTLAEVAEIIDREHTLLVLDNLEHVIEQLAPVVSELIAASPRTKILTTSRQSLKLHGELEFPLEPLPIPDFSRPTIYGSTQELAKLAECPSVQMFVDRCQSVRPDTQLTINNAPHFAAICAKLEGIPLAIEIAAGLSNTFAPSQMVKHLENRLSALSSRRRDIPARHRSLRAAIEYGYAFLTPELQRFFAALSVFRGGFTTESAKSVCLEWLGNREEALSLILDLQERSFLRPEEDSGDLRFRLLEVFREFGEECLTREELADLKGRHAQFYLDTSVPESTLADAEERSRQLARIEADYSNYLAALEHLYQEKRVEECIRLIGALSTLWDTRGTKQVEQNYIRQLVNLPETEKATPAARIHLLRMLGTTYLRTSDFRSAYQACKDALKVAKETKVDGQIAVCYYGMALCAGYMGQADHCIELCQQVLDHAPASNGILLERTYVSIGSAYWAKDDLPNAQAAFIQAKEISEAFRNGEADALIFAHLSGVYLDQQMFDQAMTAAGEGIRISRRLRNEISLSACLTQVARYHRMLGNMPAAVATSHEALLLGRDVAIATLALEAIRGHALILCQFHEHGAAATLVAATLGMEASEKRVDARERELALGEVRAKLSAEEFERAWAKGLAMDMDEAFALALKYK